MTLVAHHRLPDEHVDAALPRRGRVDALVAVLGLPDPAVGQRVADVIGVRAEVLFVRRVSHGQLHKDGLISFNEGLFDYQGDWGLHSTKVAF